MEPGTAASLRFRLGLLEGEAPSCSSSLLCSTTQSSVSLLSKRALSDCGLPALFAWGASVANRAAASQRQHAAESSNTLSCGGRLLGREPSPLTFSSSKRFPLCLNAPPSEVQPLSYLIYYAEHPQAQPAPSPSLVKSIRGRPLWRKRDASGKPPSAPPVVDAVDQSLYQSFRELDTNRDGCIDKAELETALLKMGLPASREYVAEVMDQYDSDKSSSIDFDEFRLYVRRNEQHLKRAFRHFDADDSGEILSSDLVAALRQTGASNTSEGDVRRMMELLSRGRSGRVTFTDFCRFACLLPKSQVSTGNHVLYAWANSAFWEDDRDVHSFKIVGGSGQQQRLVDHLSGSPNEPFHRLLIGGVSGALSRTIIAPIERLRTMMMLSASNVGLRSAMAQMWQDGGFSGLFKGHLSTVVKVFPTSAIQFGVVHQTKQLIRQLKGQRAAAAGEAGGGELNQFDCFLAGALAGGLSCVVSHPLDTIRTAMAVAIGSRLGMVGTARAIVLRSGLGGLYSGFGLSCMQEVLGNGLGFLAVDVGSQLFRQHHDGMAPQARDRALIAALGAAAVMTALMPLDVVVKKLQVQGCAGHPAIYSGPLDAFVRIAQQQGLGAFYRGLSTTYLKTAPSMGCVYFFYDALSRVLGVGGLTRYRLQHD